MCVRACLRACVRVCVCGAFLCVLLLGGGGGIILYVNCFGRTMLYVCIEYHI